MLGIIVDFLKCSLTILIICIEIFLQFIFIFIQFYRIVFSRSFQQTFGRLVIVEKTPTRLVMVEKQIKNESYE